MNKNTYMGGQIEHNDSRRPRSLDYLRNVHQLEGCTDSDELLARYLANRFATQDVKGQFFTEMPEWNLFNAASITVRMRTLVLLQQNVEHARPMIDADRSSVKLAMQRVLEYCISHQATLSKQDILHLVDELVKFKVGSFTDFNEALAGNTVPPNEDIDDEIVAEKLAVIVYAAYRAGVSSAELQAWLATACVRQNCASLFSQQKCQSVLRHSCRINDPEW